MDFIIFAVILTIGGFIALSVKKTSFVNRYAFKVTKKSFLALFLMVLSLLGFVTKIDANMVGIVYDPFQGGVQDTTLSEGYHIINPFQQITKITTKNRMRVVETYGQTEDAIYATFQLTIIYKVESLNAGMFYRVTSDADIADQQFSSLVKEALQRNAVMFDIYEILGSDLDVLRTSTETDLKEIFFDRYSITVVSLSIDDVDAGPQIEEIIQNKAQAIQEIEIAQKELERAQIDADTRVVAAQAEADALVVEKEAQAAGILLVAEAEAAAIQLKLEQVILSLGLDPNVPLTDVQLKVVAEYMAYLEYLTKWDGQLPTFVSDGSASFILTLPD